MHQEIDHALIGIGVGIISSKRRYRGGLKKCVPQKFFAKSSLPALRH
jgi:hypothetical protein